MMVRARQLQVGQRIHIEYGAHGNWADITIEGIHRFQQMVTVMFRFGTIRSDVSFRPDEQVEVLREDAGHA